MLKISCTPNILRAALTHAADGDCRFYLNAVAIERTTRGIAVVASDGHRMFVATQDAGIFEGDEPIGSLFIVPRSLIAAIRSTDKSIELVLASGQAVLTICDAKGSARTVSMLMIDARYPEWRRVVPYGEPRDTSPGQFNIEYLADANKALQILGGKYTHIQHRGSQQCAIISADGISAFVVVMPVHPIVAGDVAGILAAIDARPPEALAA
jgi:hypothetical protein